jgi:molybdopterin converting factor small subunit
VTVQLFASYADLVGKPAIEVPFQPGDMVSDLLRKLRALPLAATLPTTPRVAVNQSFAGDNTPLHLGDEVALIPPVAGG